MSCRQCFIPCTAMSKHYINFEFSLCDHIRWQHLVGGVTGGVFSTLIVHPLDLIKIRFQGVIILFFNCTQINAKISQFKIGLLKR